MHLSYLIFQVDLSVICCNVENDYVLIYNLVLCCIIWIFISVECQLGSLSDSLQKQRLWWVKLKGYSCGKTWPFGLLKSSVKCKSCLLALHMSCFLNDIWRLMMLHLCVKLMVQRSYSKSNREFKLSLHGIWCRSQSPLIVSGFRGNSILNVYLRVWLNYWRG